MEIGAPGGCPEYASGVDLIEWPALPPPAGQSALALQFQMARSQWWPAPRLRDHQFRQLRELVAHAVTHVPHYREHLRRAQVYTLAGLTPESFLRWPILHRHQVQAGTHALRAHTLPASHGEVTWSSTSGSTGEPVQVANSMLGAFMQSAAVVRSHDWFRLDRGLRLAAIRRGAGEGRFADWGPATRGAHRTGDLLVCDLAVDIGAQFEWLLDCAPAYLLSTGNNLRSLILESRKRGRRPDGLRALLSFADALPDDLADLARETWGVPVHDTYSAGELGVLALQCPEHGSLHAQAENVYMEILREDGSPCAPGETGRVVATDLHNFAMPLIRYALGDYAEAGQACGCGRGLPTISRIAGRASAMLVDPAGRRFWPQLNPLIWADLPVEQRQFIQHAPDLIEMRYTASRALGEAETARLSEGLQRSLRYPYTFRFTRVGSLARAAGLKFQEVVGLGSPGETT